MPGNIGLLALSILVAAPLAGLAACSEVPRHDSPGDTQRIAGALDNILLCENSDERTSMVFPHRKHYAPLDQGGSAIACGDCHHDYEGPGAAPPGSCRTCHAAHDVVVEKAMHTLWIAAHERCGSCHNSPRTAYPDAPVYAECDDCHGLAEEAYLVGEGLKVSLSVVAKGPLLDSVRIERFFKERYEDDEVALSEETDATAKATYVFQVIEVFDDLIPASSSVILFQGTCQITIVYEDKELLRQTLHSKIISGENRGEVHRIITDNLMRSAYRASARALDEAMYD